MNKPGGSTIPKPVLVSRTSTASQQQKSRVCRGVRIRIHVYANKSKRFVESEFTGFGGAITKFMEVAQILTEWNSLLNLSTNF